MDNSDEQPGSRGPWRSGGAGGGRRYLRGTPPDGRLGQELDAGIGIRVPGWTTVPGAAGGTDDARFLSDDQPVFGLEGQGGERPRAYPQLVLVWHEIVNDRVDGRPLTVTYCPLTGTAIAFTGPPDRAALTFGTTGNLVNSNLLMYDRQTDSTWPQITGTAITGKRKGQRLETTPLVWTNRPVRLYTRDSGYYAEGGPIFPVLARDRSRRFADKDVVVGVRRGEHRLAVAKKRIEREGSVRAELGGAPVTLRWNRTLGAAHLADDGGATEAFDAMWFAWYSFYPDTRVRS